MLFDFSIMALRIRTRRLNFEGLSTVHMIAIIVVASLGVGLLFLLDKKKPEWQGLKNRLIMISAILLWVL